MKNFNNALIIDDDSDLCFILRRVLHETIENVYCAQTLREGLEMFQGMKPDVVFLDNNLPDGQGVDAIKGLKVQTPGSLIILITSSNAKVEATLNGADVFLKKPFTSSSVRDALKTERPPALWPM